MHKRRTLSSIFVLITFTLYLKQTNMKNIKNLKTYVEELSNDFIDDYLTTPELQQRFIDQVMSYGKDCCETEQELLCFVDGLLMSM